MELSAGEVHDEGEEGGTGAHTGRSHWVNQISLDLPRASDPVWVAGRGLQALGSSCHPGWQQLSQVSAQQDDRVVKLGGGKGYK